MFQKKETSNIESGFDSNARESYIFLVVFRKLNLRHWVRGLGLIQTVQWKPYIFIAEFQKLNLQHTLSQSLIQKVQGGGLHFSSSVSDPETFNIGSEFDANSAGGIHFSSTFSETETSNIGSGVRV